MGNVFVLFDTEVIGYIIARVNPQRIINGDDDYLIYLDIENSRWVGERERSSVFFTPEELCAYANKKPSTYYTYSDLLENAEIEDGDDSAISADEQKSVDVVYISKFLESKTVH